MKTCAVIPAAGRGSRLNTTIPKLLLPITRTKTLWNVLKQTLTMVEHIHVIVSPEGERIIREHLANDLANQTVSLSIQPKPIGMGDAIFQGYKVWSQAEKILVVWGDQAFISEDTCHRSLQEHTGTPKSIVLPLTWGLAPYVEYVFDSHSQLTQVKQSREGDACSPQGFSDVGTFVLSVNDLWEEWNAYLLSNALGRHTKEINFLPFLPFLAARGWHVCPVLVKNAIEARGINTPDDLLFTQQHYEGIKT